MARRARSGLRLINETRYNGRDLRKLILRAFLEEGVDPRHHTVFVKHSQGTLRGRALVNWPQITLWVPGPEELNIENLAKILVHEIGHNQGLEHKDMVQVNDIDVRWGRGPCAQALRPETKAKA